MNIRIIITAASAEHVTNGTEETGDSIDGRHSEAPIVEGIASLPRLDLVTWSQQRHNCDLLASRFNLH
jgi:hypothetical protein